MAEWIKFNGSKEHRKLLRDACDFRLKLKDGTETALINGSCEFAMIDQILICERHPHAEMIIEWARTGRPVYRKYQDGIWRIDPDPTWDKHEKYEFEQPKEKFRYKAALMRGGEYYITVAYTDEGVAGIQRYSSFVRWLHEDWQEVEV